jgi:CubicO group peptidase (beta-lactamase class C family)
MSGNISRTLYFLVFISLLAACTPPTSKPVTITSSPTVTATATAVSDDEIAARLDSLLTKLAAESDFTGSALVARGDNILISKGYGEADRAKKTPNTAQTKFRIASVTKEFTSMAILILQAEGRLNVHDRICNYISDCPSTWQAITIHHLLTHTSGIPDYYSSPGWENFTSMVMSPSDIITQFKDKPLDFQPSAGWKYSNSGYVLLGHIIEQVSGMTYGEFLQEKIFSPLKMMDSGYLGDVEGMAVGYAKVDTVTPAKFEDPSGLFASGGLYSTTGDLYLWDKALYTDILISKELREVMLTPHADVPLADNKYGYGWFIGDTVGHPMVGHTGRIEGFTSFNAYYPEDKTAVVVLCNQWLCDVQSIGIQLTYIAFGLDVTRY